MTGPTDVTESPVRGEAPPVADVTETPSESPTVAYTYVRLPSGEVRAIRNDEIRDAAITEKSDAPASVAIAEKEAEFYVHLANGDHVRVKESDLPPGAGTNAPLGFWQRGNSVFHVVGVYPVEIETVEGK